MSAPSDAATFLGRFHPVLVHLPIGLIFLLFSFELLRFSRRFRDANTNSGLVLILAVPLSLVTAACGWLLSRSGGYEHGLLNWHKWTGVGTAGSILLAALLYWLEAKKAYRVCIAAAFGVLLVASHFGGSLTHGSGYLTQYAPNPIRVLVSGKRPDQVDPTTQAHLNSNPRAWADVVQPILADKCLGCHGPEKSKGGLRLDSVQLVLKGGEAGLVETDVACGGHEGPLELGGRLRPRIRARNRATRHDLDDGAKASRISSRLRKPTPRRWYSKTRPRPITTSRGRGERCRP